MRTLTGMILIAAVITVIACDHTFVEPGGNFLSGSVTDSDTSLPIDSVLVGLKSDLNSNTAIASTYTDSLGRYTLFAARWEKVFYVVTRKEGYRRNVELIVFLDGDTVAVNFKLQKE